MLEVMFGLMMFLNDAGPQQFERRNADGSVDRVEFNAPAAKGWSKVRGQIFFYCVKSGVDPKALERLTGRGYDSFIFLGTFSLETRSFPEIKSHQSRRSR